MKRMRRALLAAGLAAAGMAGTLAFAGTASATASAVAAYNGVCGDGYGVIDHADIGSLGTVYLTWNNATGKNCVVTVRAAKGVPTRMVAYLSQTAQGGAVHAVDDGFYTIFAGPVYVPARDQCVVWRGTIGDNTVDNAGHCG